MRWLIIVTSYLLQAVILVVNVFAWGWAFGLAILAVSNLVGYLVAIIICRYEVE